MTKKYKIILTAQYKKSYKKMAKRGLRMSSLDAIVENLSLGNHLPRRYKGHALKGAYANYRECHIYPDWLLVYKREDDRLILTLIDTGTHSDLFNL